VLPVFPDGCHAKRLAILHGDGVGMAFHSKKLSIGRMQRRSL
jgi:hypothetical protein